ncbi:MAG: EamA family transporter [Actinobacteria bacterium]|nr:EamA family transporter [Actinomycetota bacterium]MUH57715.1 EamA family transporter [Actinomycetota bacterium]
MKSPSVLVLLMVLFAGVLHAGWNAVAKGLSDTRTNFGLINIGVFVFSLVVLPFTGFSSGHILWYVAASVAIHLVYEFVLMTAYDKGDFSTSYPVARGVAPLLVSFTGVVLAHEHLTAWSLTGIVVVAVGIISLSWSNSSHSSLEGTLWALGTGVAIALYTVIDGYGVRASDHALQYGATLFAIQSFLWVGGVTVKKGLQWIPSRRVLILGALGGVVSMVAYTIVLWAQTRTTLGVVSALRETGVLWAAIIGVVIFREGRAVRIVLPAAVVALGIGLLALG